MERCVQLSDLCHGPDSSETAKHLDNLAVWRSCWDSTKLRVGDSASDSDSGARVPVRTRSPQSGPRELLATACAAPGVVLEADQLEGLVLAAKAAEEPPSLTGSHVLDDL